MNNCSFIGRLTADATSRAVRDTTVTSFTLAVQRPMKKDVTDFIRCSAWGKTGDVVCNYTRKGSQLAIEGNLISNNYENKEGQKVTTWEINVQKVHLLGGRQDSQNGSNSSRQDAGAGLQFDNYDNISCPF